MYQPKSPRKPLGTLQLPLVGKKFYTVTGGPFPNVPREMVGLKMAAEISHPHDISIPTVDFSVPPAGAMKDGLIDAVDAITKGEPLYVGCMAGKGRTGLFLAVLAKAWGIEDPVGYVRATYYAHAVETDEQKEYVENYPVPASVKKVVFWAKVKSVFRIKNDLTNKVKRV